MIDAAQVDALAPGAAGWPRTSRLHLLDACTHLSLTPSAWRSLVPLAESLIGGFEPDAVDVLVRVPLASVRRRLRDRARSSDATGLQVAQALALQHDDAGAAFLAEAFAHAPDGALAQALACALQPGSDVDVNALRPGLAADDEATRLWTAIAIARVDRPQGHGPDLEPLEQVWDALVCTPEQLQDRRHVLLHDRPPRQLAADPSWAASQLAQVRPLPPRTRDFVLRLKEHDFDGWVPRRPAQVEDSSELRAFVAALTGEFDRYGDPLPPPTPAPAPVRDRAAAAPALLAWLDVLLWPDHHLHLEGEARTLLAGLDGASAATVFELTVGRLSGLAASQPDAPPWVTGNALVAFAAALPAGAPLPIGRILTAPHLRDIVPRSQLAWALARAGETELVEQMTQLLRQFPPAERPPWAEWLRDIAAQLDAPQPILGAGGSADPAPPVVDLIEDQPTFAAQAPSFDFVSAAPAGTGYGADHPFEDALLGAEPRTGAEPPGAAAAPSDAAAHAPAAEPTFVFELSGEQARRDAICAHTSAELQFRFEVPGADVLARVDHPALQAARRADLDLMLELSSTGNLSLRGARSGVARFRGGAMVEPLRFALTAGAADETSGVHVDFIVEGEVVHQQDLAIVVVADEAALAGRFAEAPGGAQLPASLLADAAAAGPPPPHRLRLALGLDADGVHLDLTHWIGGAVHRQSAHPAPGLDRARIEALAAALRTDLAAVYQAQPWRSFDGEIPAGDGARPVRLALARALAAAAAAGARLNASLRDGGGDALARALDYIEHELPAGAVLTVATGDVFLPWEILYPRPWSAAFTDAQKAEFPLDPAAFWGARFAIETVQQRGSGPVAPLKEVQIAHAPRVSINLNPAIAMSGLADSSQPLAVQRAWAERLRADGRLEGLQDDCDAMRAVLQDADSDATLIYVYCHGSAANPFGGSDEVLQLADNCQVGPADLAGSTRYAGAPIVFLNSCQSGAHSPLAFASFLQAFRRRGALGMIAASFPVPVVFGAHFGAAVVERYLERRGSLAVALLGLRRRHLIERGNPVPLFYALQCQLSFPEPPAAGAHP